MRSVPPPGSFTLTLVSSYVLPAGWLIVATYESLIGNPRFGEYGPPTRWLGETLALSVAVGPGASAAGAAAAAMRVAAPAATTMRVARMGSITRW